MLLSALTHSSNWPNWFTGEVLMNWSESSITLELWDISWHTQTLHTVSSGTWMRTWRTFDKTQAIFVPQWVVANLETSDLCSSACLKVGCLRSIMNNQWLNRVLHKSQLDLTQKGFQAKVIYWVYIIKQLNQVTSHIRLMRHHFTPGITGMHPRASFSNNHYSALRLNHSLQEFHPTQQESRGSITYRR